MLHLLERLNRIFAERTGQDIARAARDSDRDNFMSATQAVEYGLVDEVLRPWQGDQDLERSALSSAHRPGRLRQ